MNTTTVPQPVSGCNAPSALDHANAMVDHLRSVGPGFGHELARAMLVSAAFYLRDTFGREHALSVMASLVPPVLGVDEPVPAEPPPEMPIAASSAVTLH